MKKVLLSLLGLLSSLFLLVGWFYLSLPDINELKKCMKTSMFEIQLCPGSPQYVPLSQVSPLLQKAILVSEDSTFWTHKGFDWFELKASFKENLKEKKFKRGGSTLSQQLVKNVFLNSEKSLFRKLREAILTYQLEEKFSKKEIFERYLNVVEFGPNIYGVLAASKKYFGTHPSDLNVLQASFLAYLLPSPKKYSRVLQRGITDFSRRRILTICMRLEATQTIDEGSCVTAKARIMDIPWTQYSKESFQPSFGQSLQPGDFLSEDEYSSGQASEGFLSSDGQEAEPSPEELSAPEPPTEENLSDPEQEKLLNQDESFIKNSDDESAQLLPAEREENTELKAPPPPPSELEHSTREEDVQEKPVDANLEETDQEQPLNTGEDAPTAE